MVLIDVGLYLTAEVFELQFALKGGLGLTGFVVHEASFQLQTRRLGLLLFLLY